MNSSTRSDLEQLLLKRLAVIGDHALRERDAGEHLAQLRGASEALDGFFHAHRAELPARLCHFLLQASYQKALEYVREAAA